MMMYYVILMLIFMFIIYVETRTGSIREQGMSIESYVMQIWWREETAQHARSLCLKRKPQDRGKENQ